MSYKIGYLPSSTKHQKDLIFSKAAARDGVEEPYANLKAAVEKLGGKLHTLDCYGGDLTDLDMVIVTRLDANFKNISKAVKSSNCRVLYVVTEERTVCGYHDERNLRSKLFDAVMTWDDNLVDGEYFLKYCYPNPKRSYVKGQPFSDKKLGCIINAFKIYTANGVGELYSKRMDVIEKLASEEGFDLFGMGWDKCKTPSVLKANKGPVKSKAETYANYRFAFAIENTGNEKGAVTEKMFDAMAAGCVPVYLGAPNVTDYVPANCFVDMRDFDSVEKLWEFLGAMDEGAYEKYQKNIEKYLSSEAYDQFTSVGYVRTMLDAIDKVMNKPIRKKIWWQIKLEWLGKCITQPIIFKRARRLWFDLLTS